MANSSLFRTGEQDPVVTRGHGTSALGPSDSTDSGSDIRGGPGLNADDDFPLDRGTTSDPDHDGPGANAGADIGDADLDSDSDRWGTGERGAAGRDSTLPTDEILSEDRLDVADGEENPLDFSPRLRRGRRTAEPLDEALDDSSPDEDDTIDREQQPPAGGEKPGLISGGVGGRSGTGKSGGTVGPGSGRNPGRR